MTELTLASSESCPLNTLSRNLLDAIVGFVSALDRKLPLLQLCLVNREFASLCQPRIWRRVTFRNRKLEDIFYFVDHIYLRQKQHVRDLVIDQDTPIGADAVDRLLGVDDSEVDHDSGMSLRILSQQSGYRYEQPEHLRRTLFAYIIEDLGPQLEAIEIDWMRIGDEFHIIDALQTCVNVKAFQINGDGGDVNCTGHHLAKIILAMPNLERFTSSIAVDHEGLDKFCNALTNLEHLTSLSLRNADYICDNYFFAWKFKAPLRALALQGCPELSFEYFRHWVHQFSESLTALDIDNVPHHYEECDNRRYSGMPFDLPKLDTVRLSTKHDSSFLNSFVNAPLVEFEFNHCPRITFPAFAGRMRDHSSTLKTVILGPKARLVTAQVDLFELCYAKDFKIIKHLAPRTEIDSDDSAAESDGYSDMYFNDWEFRDQPADECYGDDDFEGAMPYIRRGPMRFPHNPFPRYTRPLDEDEHDW